MSVTQQVRSHRILYYEAREEMSKDLKYIEAQLFIHWVGCECNGIKDYYGNIVDRAKSHLVGDKRMIYVERVSRGKYICIFRIVNTIDNCVSKMFQHIKNIKNIAFYQDIEVCKCTEGVNLTGIKELLCKEKYPIKQWSVAQGENYHNTNLYDYTYRNVPKGWEEFFDQNRFVIKDISDSLSKEEGIIYPPLTMTYNAFNLCKPQDIRVIILGQDPYPHNPGEAMGLSFSVPKGIKIPSSLRNIQNELRREGYNATEDCGDLSKWAKRGVFLLNTSLTVKAKTPASHTKLWKSFTTRLIIWLNQNVEGVVWALWGNYAESYVTFIKSKKHITVTNVHPSGYNTSTWTNSKPFSAINEALEKLDKPPMDWNL